MAREEDNEAEGCDTESEENLSSSELVCDPDLEKMLHHRQLKRDIERAARGRGQPVQPRVVAKVKARAKSRGGEEPADAQDYAAVPSRGDPEDV